MVNGPALDIPNVGPIKLSNLILKSYRNIDYLALGFLLSQPVGQPSLPEVAAVVWEVISTVFDPSI